MLLLISEGCTHSFFFLLQKEPFDWPTYKYFGKWGTPQNRSLNMLPSPKIKGSFVMLPFKRYLQWENKGKHDKEFCWFWGQIKQHGTENKLHKQKTKLKYSVYMAGFLTKNWWKNETILDVVTRSRGPSRGCESALFTGYILAKSKTKN
jgi:hypothetical protein